MKRIIFALLSLLVFFEGKAQDGEIQVTYRLSTTLQLKSYVGNAKRLYVSQTNSDYVLCTDCVANDTTVIQGSGSRKWKSVFPPTNVTLVNNGSSFAIINNLSATSAGNVLDATQGKILNDSIVTKLKISDTTNKWQSKGQYLIPSDTINKYQGKGNYLSPNDTTGKWQGKANYLLPTDTINKWQGKGNYISPADTVGKWQGKAAYLLPIDTVNKWQRKGTYLIPQDTVGKTPIYFSGTNVSITGTFPIFTINSTGSGSGSAILYSGTGQNVDGSMTQAATTNALANKVDVVAGKGLSKNDYTDVDKAKVAATSGTNTGDQDLSGMLVKTNNLSDVSNTVTARANLGLGTAATQASSVFEPALGNPSTSGYVLSSTATGTRAWVAQSSGSSSGTVTSISQGIWMNNSVNPITTTGTLNVDSLAIVARMRQVAHDSSGTLYFSQNDFYGAGTTSGNPIKIKGKADSTSTVTAIALKNDKIQVQQGGTNTGASNPATINFTGAGVTATQSGSAVTVNIAGGGSGSSSSPVTAAMYSAASQTFSSGGFEKVLLDTKDFDADNTLTDLTHSKFTIPATGFYRISITGRINPIGGGEHQLGVVKNGSIYILNANQYSYASGNPIVLNGSIDVSLASGDYLELFAYLPTGSTNMTGYYQLALRMSVTQIH